MFSESEKQFLLRVARTSIESAVCHGPAATLSPIPASLQCPSGAFVTLHCEGELRGCIGYIEAQKPLVETVQEAAMRAALDDYRFPPVTPGEVSRLDIEISVLSPLRAVGTIEAISVGTHGLIVESRHHRGLLLPQVPVEQGWDRETFLSQTCRKAGLPPTAWREPGVKLFTFTADIFSDSSVRVSHA